MRDGTSNVYKSLHYCFRIILCLQEKLNYKILNESVEEIRVIKSAKKWTGELVVEKNLYFYYTTNLLE